MSAKCARSGLVFSSEEMADALFDTTVFIDAYNGHQGAEHLVQQVITGARTASVSPISVFELWLRSMTRREEMRHRALLALLEEAYLDASAARQMAGWLKGSARPVRLRLAGDATIAATASERGEPLYTRNVRDFQRFYANVRSY